MRYRRFDEAVESHQKAANALEEALHSISLPKAVVSIKLQREFHLKHIELIRLKKQQYEKYKLAVEQQRLKNAEFLEQRLAKDRLESACDLQISIFKVLEESDILLDALGNGRKLSGGSRDSDSVKSAEAVMEQSETATIENICEVKMNIAKKAKDETTVIDELHTLNHQLHILIYSMVSRLDECSQESESLRERIRSIEKEKVIQRVQPLVKVAESNVKEDSARASVSTPDRELNRRCSLTGEERKVILPDSSNLPPLELPDFDYSTFENEL